MHTQWVFLLLAVMSVSFCFAKHPRGHRRFHDGVHCFSAHELAKSSDKVLGNFVGHKMDWKKYSAVQLVDTLEAAEKQSRRRKRTTENKCPNFDIISKGKEPFQRSISPWEYRIDVDESRYPQKLAFAHCLCKHCISTFTGKETHSLNSVLLHQSMLVLRREVCPWDEGLYTFTLRSEEVPVACTCTVPLYG